MEEIAKTGTRGTSENFIRQRPGSTEMLYTTSRAVQPAEPVAVVCRTGDRPLVEVRNVLATGEPIEYMATGIESLPVTLLAMHNENGEEITRANPGNRVYLTTEPPLTAVRENGILRREKPSVM